jgi:hypothetical protein
MLARVQCSYCDPDFVSEKNKAYADWKNVRIWHLYCMFM